MRTFFCLAFAAAISAISFADEVKKEKEKEAFTEIDLKDVKLGEAEGKGEPVKIASDEELTKAVGEEAAKAVAKSVDFKKQYLVFFQWAGSGQDKLTASSETADKKTTVTFTKKLGRTKDLRQHAKLFAINKDAEYKFGK